MPEFILFIGTYTKTEPHVDGKAEGIYVYSLDTEQDKLVRLHTERGIVNPSFCIVSKDKKYLFAVSEIDDFPFRGDRSGAVFSYAIDPQTFALRQLSAVPSMGEYPCHLSEDPTGKYLYAANYNSGSSAMFPLHEDGCLGPASFRIQHEGKSINPVRQEGPHAHSIHVDLSNKYLIVPDLGLDTVLVYEIDRTNGQFSPTEKSISMTPGAGPRHFTYHPNRRFAYVINELGSTISVFTYNSDAADRGDVFFIQTEEVTTLPGDFQGESTCAEVAVHPNGRFLYASNRGHDSISLFSIDGDSGRLHFIGTESTRGRTPRHFALTPDGDRLIAANQDSDTIVLYKIDEQTGALEYRKMIDVPSPVCLWFY